MMRCSVNKKTGHQKIYSENLSYSKDIIPMS